MFANIFYRSYLNPGEAVLYVAHSHPITIYKNFIAILLFGIALPGFFYLLMPPFWFLWGIWAAIGGLKIVSLWVDWYYDALLVTNQNLIDIEWTGLFKRSASRFEYHTLEGVSYEFKSFWGILLNYGDITIERIGSGKVIGLQKVSFPRKVEREILSAQNEFIRNKSFRDHQTLQGLLANMLQDHTNFKF